MSSSPPTDPITCPVCKVTDPDGTKGTGPAHWERVQVEDCNSGQLVETWAGTCDTHPDHWILHGPRTG